MLEYVSPFASLKIRDEVVVKSLIDGKERIGVIKHISPRAVELSVKFDSETSPHSIFVWHFSVKKATQEDIDRVEAQEKAELEKYIQEKKDKRKYGYSKY